THTNMRQENGRAQCFYERAFPGHIRAGEKNKIVLRIKMKVVGYRIGKKNMVKILCFHDWRILFDEFRKRKIESFYSDCHGIPGVQAAVNFYEFKRGIFVPATQMVTEIKVLPGGKFFTWFSVREFGKGALTQ